MKAAQRLVATALLVFAGLSTSAAEQNGPPKNMKAAIAQIESLKEKVTSLEGQLAKAQKDAATLSNWVHWNDFVVENREQIGKALAPKFDELKNRLFTMAGGEGSLQAFEIDDVLFYKGMIVVPTVWLSTFSDGSAALGRLAVGIDPLQNFAVVGCSMGEAKAIRAEDLKKMQPAQLEAEAAALPKSKEEFKFKMTPETKNALINGGIVVGVGILTKMLTGN